MSKRILIVEDHADIRKLVRLTLEFEDYEIHEAANADEGLEAVRRLAKTDLALGRPQVVLLTARGQSQDVEAGMNAGADAYLLKPFSPLKLIETIDTLGAQPTELP